MSVSYNGKKIIPSPLITINKQYQKTGDGDKTGILYNITANGTLLPFIGSPSGNYSDIDDAFWTLGGYPPDEPVDGGAGANLDRILRKQEAFRHLFRNDGKSFEWQPAGGQPVVKCNPRIIDISFQEGVWYDRCNYSINLEADWIMFTNYPSGEDFNILESPLIQDASENWSFEEIDGFEGTAFNVQHSVSAKGILGYDENGVSIGPAWQNAKDWVDTKAIGTIDTLLASGATGFSTFQGGKFTKNTSIDEKTGNYSVTESWILSSGTSYIEENFSCTRNIADDSFIARYDGTIFGIQDGEDLGGDQAIVKAKAQVPTDANARISTINAVGTFLDGNVLGTSPTTRNIGINNQTGSVTFSFEWSADEDSTFNMSCEASLDFSRDANLYTLRLVCNIDGIGNTPEDRLDNANNAVLSNTEALQLAKDLVGDALPAGVTIVSDPTSTAKSVNENSGSVRTSSTWISTNSDDPEITVQNSFASDIFAELTIPGKTNGPILQDMNTQTSQVITVNLTSSNNTSKPNNAVTIAQMNAYAEADFDTGDAATWLLKSDQDNFSHKTGRYTRTRVYVVT